VAGFANSRGANQFSDTTYCWTSSSQNCMCIYQSIFTPKLHSFNPILYEWWKNACILVWHWSSEMHDVISNSHVCACFVIGMLLSEVGDDATVRIKCSKPLPKCTYFKLVKSVFAQHTPFNHSACFCKLPWGCCGSQLPARPYHWAIIRHLYSVGLHPRIDVLDVCTCKPCVKRSMSIGSQSCDHCKGQSLVVTLSYCTLSQMRSLVVPNCMPTYLVSEPVNHPHMIFFFPKNQHFLCYTMVLLLLL